MVSFIDRLVFFFFSFPFESVFMVPTLQCKLCNKLFRLIFFFVSILPIVALVVVFWRAVLSHVILWEASDLPVLHSEV